MRRLFAALIVFAAASSAAQQLPIFDPDDFIDPRGHRAPIFFSRLVLGALRSGEDHYRPLGQDAGFLHLANSVYWSNLQVDFKITRLRGENANGPRRVRVCPCDPPVYFPTPAPRDVTPAPPLPGTRESLQFAWYRAHRINDVEPAVMLRYRLTINRQNVDTVVATLNGNSAGRLRGREQSFGLDADTDFRIAGRDLLGTLRVGRTSRTGTADDRSQNELAYQIRSRGRMLGPVAVRALFTVGAVGGRGTSGVNVINPAVEAFLHDLTSAANVHLIWSPMTTRDGKGWAIHHQILLSVDRVLIHKLLAPR